MENLNLTLKEMDLLRAAVSFLKTNIPKAEDSLDIEISEGEVEALEGKVYQAFADLMYQEKIAK
jgi:hypothetical protein